MTSLSDAVDLIAQANPMRSTANLDRRLIKMLEELGELAEAFLSVTSEHNDRNKTWADVQEEAVDVLIVATDIALTPLNEDQDAQAVQQRLIAYTQNNAHLIDLGFNDLIWRICGFNTSFANYYRHDQRYAEQFASNLVCYAFALNELLDHPQPKQLCGEVTRKIMKWKRRRPKID